jgi:hypothetical protein
MQVYAYYLKFKKNLPNFIGTKGFFSAEVVGC